MNIKRLERIIKKLLKQQDIVDAAEKGGIEINFSGDSETITIKIVVQ